MILTYLLRRAHLNTCSEFVGQITVIVIVTENENAIGRTTYGLSRKQ